MYGLFIDTHDKNIVLCLYKNNDVIDSIIKETTQQHTDFAMSLLDNLIHKNNLKIKDINEIIVVNGPGSFTGVRIGVTIAKMLAYTLKIAIKTITSLELIAVNTIDVNNKLVLVRDIKGAYGAVFDKNNTIVNNYFYLNNNDLNEFIKKEKYNVFEDVSIDFKKVISYMKSKEKIIPHAVNPIYIKVIEALK